MAIFTLVSPGSGTGTTTTGLAVSYTWGGRALLTECDPSGGAVLTGFLAGRMEQNHGSLLDLALAIAHNPNPSVLWEHAIALDQEAREWLLLPGLRDPRQATQLDGAWEQIADILRTACDDAVDVLIDAGQIGGRDTPMRLIAASDLIVMLVKPTLRQVSAAQPRLETLGRYIGDRVPVALCLVGKGDYGAKRVAENLYDLPVIAELPHDPRSAAMLSDGRRAGRRLRVSRLMRGAAALGVAMRKHLADTEQEKEELKEAAL